MICVLLLAALMVARPTTPVPEGSYLYFPATRPDGRRCARVEPYCPREGDLVLFDDELWYWHLLYRFPAMTEPPDHSGIVILRPYGTAALLESGPDNNNYVRIQDAIPRLTAFKGTIWIRRVKKPLVAEHSAALTNFALAQEGKRYAIWRLLMQGTPFRARGKYAGKANILYPRDIIDNHAFDFSDTWEDPGIWSACALNSSVSANVLAREE